MKQPVFRDKHFYILLALFIACTIFYYFGELVILFGWEALRWDIFYTVHDPHRMLFLVPILYSSYHYRLRGALLSNVASLLIFLPRAFFISPYPDATLRMVAFVILAIVISMLTALTFNDRDKRNKLTDALKQSEEKTRSILVQMYDSYYEVDLAGNFTFVNDSVCRTLGYAREELVGNNYRLTTSEDDIKPLLHAFNEVFRTGAPNTGFAHGILCKDGRIISVESSISLRKNQRGEIIGFRSVSRDVTERKQADEKIERIAAEWQATFDSITDLVSIQDVNSKLVRVNKAYADAFHYKPEELAGRYCYEIVHETRCPIDDCPHQQALKTRSSITSEIFEPRLGVFLEVSCSPVFSELGEIAGTVHIAKNINQRKQAEESLRESEKKYRLLIENINDVFYTLDTQGNINYISPVVERFTLYKVSDLIGKPFIPLIHPDDLPALLESFNRLVAGQLEPWEFRVMDKDGRIIFVRTSSRPIYEGGEIVGFTALMTDITGRKLMEQKLEELATHDFLTGLPNRVLLKDRFSMAVALASRNKARLAVMSLDLDKFKTINDTLGHEAGDHVLKTVSARLTGIIRASDTLARIGGDEFVLVMQETKRMEDATAIAQKILDSFAEPLVIDGHQVHLSTSVGIAIYPEDAEDMETLIKKSDAAMYFSKGHGRNQFKFFSDGDVGISGDHKSGN